MNKMQEIRIEKVTLNIGAGRDEKVLKKAVKLIENITGIAPVQTVTQKRLAAWGLRPGLPIGAKLTIRDAEQIKDLTSRFLAAKEKRIKPSWFDNNGNISFGIHEYVDIPGVKYDTEVGILGLQVSITLTRPGFRVKRRKLLKSKVGTHQLISKEDAIKFLTENYGVTMEE
ncbi:50S ribosomal protein L5 [Candidatus Woesearchaeota archaeon]|nr:50S ribosomal protein L5 [Candidatus Woesearchaeota archaeon]